MPKTIADQFVLLLRSSLLQRYPNAIIYLTPALTAAPTTTPADLFPIFDGKMEPDINFVGFPITPAAAVGSGGNPGYFVVIQEHPTEPRLDAEHPHAAMGVAHHARSDRHARRAPARHQ